MYGRLYAISIDVRPVKVTSQLRGSHSVQENVLIPIAFQSNYKGVTWSSIPRKATPGAMHAIELEVDLTSDLNSKSMYAVGRVADSLLWSQANQELLLWPADEKWKMLQAHKPGKTSTGLWLNWAWCFQMLSTSLSLKEGDGGIFFNPLSPNNEKNH